MRAVLLASLFFLGGCVGMVTNGVRSRASFDLSCPEDQVTVRNLDSMGNNFAANGCGKKAAYVWQDGKAVLNSQVTADAPPATSPAVPQ